MALQRSKPERGCVHIKIYVQRTLHTPSLEICRLLRSLNKSNMTCWPSETVMDCNSMTLSSISLPCLQISCWWIKSDGDRGGALPQQISKAPNRISSKYDFHKRGTSTIFPAAWCLDLELYWNGTLCLVKLPAIFLTGWEEAWSVLLHHSSTQGCHKLQLLF